MPASRPFPVIPEPPPPAKYDPSKVIGTPQQEAIWLAIEDDSPAAPHVVIFAGAGCGKTFSEVHGLHRVLHYDLARIAERGKAGQTSKLATRKCGFMAFGKAIAEELKVRVPPGTSAGTQHSFGYAAIRKACGNVELDRYKVGKILEDTYGGRPAIGLCRLVEELVKHCKISMLSLPEITEAKLDEFVDYFDLDTGRYRAEAYSLIKHVVERSDAMVDLIDYDDMIRLPLIHDFPLDHFDILFIDEAQDLNKARQELSLRMGERIVIVGDPKQSIFGFCGADINSMDNMAAALKATGRAVQTFPLTYTRRCPKSHVLLANQTDPDLRAMDEAPEGVIAIVNPQEILEEGNPANPKLGDMILCRVNAPLVGMAYRLIRRNIPAVIAGKDIGTGLVALIKRIYNYSKDFGSDSRAGMISRLHAWKEKEEMVLLRMPRVPTHKLEALRDKCDCLTEVSTGLDTVKETIDRINDLFKDVDSAAKQPKNCVLLSSVHKAKGLESERVIILHPELMPHPMAQKDWEKQQELFCLHVAITRSKDTLIFSGGLPPVLHLPQMPVYEESHAQKEKTPPISKQESDDLAAIAAGRDPANSKPAPRSGKRKARP